MSTEIKLARRFSVKIPDVKVRAFSYMMDSAFLLPILAAVIDYAICANNSNSAIR